MGSSQWPEMLEVAHSLEEILRWKWAINSLSLSYEKEELFFWMGVPWSGAWTELWDDEFKLWLCRPRVGQGTWLLNLSLFNWNWTWCTSLTCLAGLLGGSKRNCMRKISDKHRLHGQWNHHSLSSAPNSNVISSMKTSLVSPAFNILSCLWNPMAFSLCLSFDTYIILSCCVITYIRVLGNLRAESMSIPYLYPPLSYLAPENPLIILK